MHTHAQRITHEQTQYTKNKHTNTTKICKHKHKHTFSRVLQLASCHSWKKSLLFSMFVYFSRSWLPYQILSLTNKNTFRSISYPNSVCFADDFLLLLLLMRLLLILLTNDLSQQNNLSEPIVEVFLETRCDKLSAVILSYSLFSREPSRCRLNSATMERSHYCPTWRWIYGR